MGKKIRIAFFDTKSYDREYFEQAQKQTVLTILNLSLTFLKRIYRPQRQALQKTTKRYVSL